MSKYRHTVLKSSKRGIVCSPETQNIILKKLSVVGDVPEVINLYVECTGTLQPLFLKKCPANSDDRSRQAANFRMHDNKDWGNEREGEYFSRKLSHEWRYACNEKKLCLNFFNGRWPCPPGNSSVMRKIRMQG